jgi:hypothetical protein
VLVTVAADEMNIHRHRQAPLAFVEWPGLAFAIYRASSRTAPDPRRTQAGGQFR